LVRLHREDNSRVRFVSYEEEATIRAIIREMCPIHEPELTLALETGMRRSELYSLEWDRVDLERRQLHLLKTKNGTARVVILTAAAVSALEELEDRRSPTSPHVCLTRYGEPMVSPRAWFELVMQEAIKKNPSLQDVTWHIFRHTYISRLVMAGVDLRTVQELAGHKDIKMTVRYAHLAPAHKLAAVDRLAEYRREQEMAKRPVTTILASATA
jgi:integrase